jgi:hypothetical protein
VLPVVQFKCEMFQASLPDIIAVNPTNEKTKLKCGQIYGVGAYEYSCQQWQANEMKVNNGHKSAINESIQQVIRPNG